MKGSLKLVKVSFTMWFLCLMIFIGIIGYVVGIRNVIFTEVSKWYFIVLMGAIFFGILFFAIGLIAITYKIRGKKIKNKSIIFTCIKVCFFLAILPIFLLWNILQPRELYKKLKSIGFKQYWKEFKVKRFILKTLATCTVVLFILPFWTFGYYMPIYLVKAKLNLISDPETISGTGSMYPTFAKGDGEDPKELSKQIVATPGVARYPSGMELFGKKWFSYNIGRGDIATFSNAKTKEIIEQGGGVGKGFIKRVVALPGDSIEIRDGIFYLNGIPQKEQYTAQPRSTFGGEFLSECKKEIVPYNKLFVMGDNRKGSSDSRFELGYIDYGDIDHVLPLEKQIGDLDKNWRDSSHDLDEASAINLDIKKYIDLLNEKRTYAGLKPLKYQPKLEQSAKLRGDIILKTNDFSFEGKISGYSMEKAMRNVGYSNYVWGEIPTQGYYEADELIKNQFELPSSKKFLLTKDFSEIGISSVRGELNGCPTQLTIQHLAGYIPPNYKQSDIDSWAETIKNLKKIQSSWKDWDKQSEVYKDNKGDIQRINEIISIRLSNAKQILFRMQANQWLTPEEKGMIDNDTSLANEQEDLAIKINKRVNNYYKSLF